MLGILQRLNNICSVTKNVRSRELSEWSFLMENIILLLKLGDFHRNLPFILIQEILKRRKEDRKEGKEWKGMEGKGRGGEKRKRGREDGFIHSRCESLDPIL